MIVDTSSVEVFTNDGELVQSALIDLGGGDVTVRIEVDGEAEVRSATVRGLVPAQL